MFKLYNFKTITMLLLSIVLLASCDKDSPATPSKSKKEMMIGAWRLDSSVAPNFKGYKPPQNGMYELTLADNSSFEMKDENRISFRNGTWNLRDNDANIQFTIVDSVRTIYSIMNIAKITETNMMLEYTDGGYLFNDYYTKK